jgi:hypothetical protein
MAKLIQRIYHPDLPSPMEIEVGLAPLSWTTSYPTYIRVEGEISPETLQAIVEYVERLGGWKWDEAERKFYPV